MWPLLQTLFLNVRLNGSIRIKALIQLKLIIKVSINEDGSYIVKGDANSEVDNENVKPENIIGKVIFRIQGAGKIQFFLASKKGWMVAIIIPIVVIVIYDLYKFIKHILYKNKLKQIENKQGNI